MATGCLWLRGGWTVRTNSPPEVFSVEPVSEIIVDNEQVAVTVQFTDADEESLFFTWVVAGDPIDPSDVETFANVINGTTVHTSRAFIRLDRVDDGDRVACVVTDGEDVTRVDWTVVIP